MILIHLNPSSPSMSHTCIPNTPVSTCYPTTDLTFLIFLFIFFSAAYKLWNLTSVDGGLEGLFNSAPHVQVSSSPLSSVLCLQEWDTSVAPPALNAGGEVEHWSALFPHQGSSFSTWLGFHHAARGADNQATGSGGKAARRDVAREKKRQLMSPNGASRETG